MRIHIGPVLCALVLTSLLGGCGGGPSGATGDVPSPRGTQVSIRVLSGGLNSRTSDTSKVALHIARNQVQWSAQWHDINKEAEPMPPVPKLRVGEAVAFVVAAAPAALVRDPIALTDGDGMRLQLTIETIDTACTQVAMVEHPWIAVAFDAKFQGQVTVVPTWRKQKC